MKATIDIPDDLYRSVKARTSLEGTTVREVAIALFGAWLDARDAPAEPVPVVREAAPEWFGMARAYARNVRHHDMASIRRSIAQAMRRQAGKQ